MKPTAATMPPKAWFLLAAILAVVGAAAARIALPGTSPTHVLGDKTLFAASSGNSGNGNGNQATFSVVGFAPANVRPGVSAPVDVRMTNTNNFAISVTYIKVSSPFTLVPGVSGCNVSGNFSTVDYTGPAITVAKDATLRLSDTSVASSRWPQIAMTNTSSNQDRCQGAQYTVNIQATAVKP